MNNFNFFFWYLTLEERTKTPTRKVYYIIKVARADVGYDYDEFEDGDDDDGVLIQTNQRIRQKHKKVFNH